MKHRNFKIQIRSDKEINDEDFILLQSDIQKVISKFRAEQEDKGNPCLGEIYNLKV